MNNRLTVTGKLVSAPETRKSPAGISITRFSLWHRSQQQQAGHQREVDFRISVVASGRELEQVVKQLQIDSFVSVTGFISRANYRQAESQLVLNAEQIELLNT